ncbi:hypothetical protein Hanom_Chr03g00277031 [Helianthus anomalus]
MSTNFIYIKDEDFRSEFDQLQAILSEKKSIFLEDDSIIVWSSQRSQVPKVSSSTSFRSPTTQPNTNRIMSGKQVNSKRLSFPSKRVKR